MTLLAALPLAMALWAACAHAATQERGGPSPAAPALADHAIGGLEDLQADVSVVKADLFALEKINKDWGLLYRLRDVTIMYREPDKFRMASRIGTFVVNGSVRSIRVPSLGIKKRDDLGDEMASRYSLFDLGVITSARLELLKGRYLREDALGGVSHQVFEITLKDAPSVRYVAWLDPKRRITTKREWYQDGQLKATFSYGEPREVATGIWVPTRIEVRNALGALAGASVYRELKVNQKLSDGLFDTSG